MNESYIVLRGKVWLLRKIDKDYTMIIIRHVCSHLEARCRYGFMNEVHLMCFPKTTSFMSKYFNRDK